MLLVFKMPFRIVLLCAILGLYHGPGQSQVQQQNPYSDWKSIEVTASAYNSLVGQGVGNPSITAWGDTLNPGMKSVAISRDLLQLGMDYGTPVKIKGLDGVFIVNDKMHPRWEKKIDIYMGVNRERALEWGSRKVEICFPEN